jgi:hypothetical protein
MADFVAQSTVFEFPEGREMVNDERALELLASCSTVTSPTTIRLSNKSFGLGAATLIANTLKPFSNVTIADISDIIAGRHEDEALQVLTTICDSLADKKLVEVNVSENALGRKGVIACQGILKGKDIKVSLFVCLQCVLFFTLLYATETILLQQWLIRRSFRTNFRDSASRRLPSLGASSLL